MKNASSPLLPALSMIFRSITTKNLETSANRFYTPKVQMATAPSLPTLPFSFSVPTLTSFASHHFPSSFTIAL